VTHTHLSAGPKTAEGTVRRPRALRLMIFALVPMAMATIIGLAWLWPHHVSAHVRKDVSQYSVKGLTLPTGKITKVRPMSCQGQIGSMPESSDQSGCASLTVRVLEGPDVGRQVHVILTQAQFRSGASVGEKVKLFRVAGQGQTQASYEFSDFDRTVPLIAIAAIFALVVIMVARWRGFAALLGLGFAGFILVEFMFPAMVSGENPLLVALVGSSAIIFVVLYTAHGFSVRTTTALVGTLFGLLLTAGLGWATARWTHLTGVVSEDDYLLGAAAPDMTLTSVVLCGIIVAGLGVLNDVTITQASAVWELADSDADQKKLFSRAMRIGRDHIASSVYTIAFATAGAGLSALLLITVYGRSLGEVAQTEALSEEIIRTLVGAIGLILAMPLTTVIGIVAVRAEGARRSHQKIRSAAADTWTPGPARQDAPVRATISNGALFDEQETTPLPRISRSAYQLDGAARSPQVK
jgi:uncharacterized membrane protein